jgi:hypothetical protein
MFSSENFHHPYPSELDKLQLAADAGITKKQVCNWFTNARMRLWQPALVEQAAQGMSAEARPLFLEKETPQQQVLTSQLGQIVDMGFGFASSATSKGWSTVPSAAPLSKSTGPYISGAIMGGPPLQLQPVYRQPELSLELRIQQALQTNMCFPLAIPLAPRLAAKKEADIAVDGQAIGALLGLAGIYGQ